MVELCARLTRAGSLTGRFISSDIYRHHAVPERVPAPPGPARPTRRPPQCHRLQAGGARPLKSKIAALNVSLRSPCSCGSRPRMAAKKVRGGNSAEPICTHLHQARRRARLHPNVFALLWLDPLSTEAL